PNVSLLFLFKKNSNPPPPPKKDSVLTNLSTGIIDLESGGRRINENKALTSKSSRFEPYGRRRFAICRICKSSVHQAGSNYCQGCAYKKGICAMCGKKILDTKNYKQTSV
uniref:Cysteine-rich PDZ-binding protein n=1 Tax=Callorhinchus milii TaxID=7868 RepID=A0A4W3H6K5_CALMI